MSSLQQTLDTIFAQNLSLYHERGFRRRVGYGRKAALVVIDMANGWTRPGSPFSCSGMDTIIPANQELINAFRAKGLPVVFTTTAYDVTSGPNSDMGLWSRKVPIEAMRTGSFEAAIDDRLAPREGEFVIAKKRASAFHGTNLSSMLKGMDVDTVVLTGVTASACVRHSTEDAIAEGFRPIVVREAVGDRIAGAIAWNLFDIDAKFGDVEPLESVLAYLARNDNSDAGVR
ncbi:isochorismatase family protein [Bradyrhizobium sp. LHD-71]|uniref:isochorismatase family protein n=1 Tax=Bradyrhizobium sp. LHD-71 TaxID=3072141 RepID=UPI00280F4190|nr:isochorismatase family protein [Bradyrhizobium sp. LHD-71]MDQ8726647.1 isochorismatase family protein [Bradyrhizobium sp. LHD-71]